MRLGYRSLAALVVIACWTCPPLLRAAVTISGFQPLVGIGLTDEFKDEDHPTFYFAENSSSPGGNWLGPGGSAYYDVALLDTGAAVSLLTLDADASFNIEDEGFRGTELQQIGGATGTIFATINDPLGIYATGLANRTGTGPLTLNTSTMRGQNSVSVLTLPEESDLPNVLGLSFASQYSTSIRADQPQIFQLNGRTVRTPQVTFNPLGSGSEGIVRRAPLTLNPSSSFLTAPSYVFNFLNVLDELPLTDNPIAPTNIQGGLFLNVSVSNDGSQLNNANFFFDTGADVTVVSEINAVQLGFDPVLDTPDFTVAILGSGGTIEAVPGFFADQLSIATVGGSFVVQNVPIVVLDVTDPSNPGNIVPGILGTNVLSGRNLVIDPNPSLGGGGTGPSLFISDPVTTPHQWASSATTADWSTDVSWSAPGVPTTLWVANVNHVSGGDQTATVSSDSTVWELNVQGSDENSITVDIQSGATLTTFSGVNLYERGGVHLSGGRLDAQFIEVLGGSVSGEGTIEVGNGPIPGQVEIRQGELVVGDGIGKLDIVGRFAASANSTVAMQLAGTAAGTLYDQLTVAGDVVLDGALEVTLSDGFVPDLGNTFNLISATGSLGGQFATINLPASFRWDLEYSDNSVVLSFLGVGLSGDYSGNGVVDAADFAVWRDSLGATGTGLAADGDGSGTIDANDYLVWKSNFGSSLPIGGSVGAASSVPEPTALMLLAVCALAVTPRARFVTSKKRRLFCS